MTDRMKDGRNVARSAARQVELRPRTHGRWARKQTQPRGLGVRSSQGSVTSHVLYGAGTLGPSPSSDAFC